jgi:excisionase family DNA binding protein
MSDILDDLPQKNHFTLSEVADFFGVNIRTVYRWINLGILQSVKSEGRGMRIPRASIVKMIENARSKQGKIGKGSTHRK